MKEVDGVFHFAALWLMHCHEFPRSAFNTNVLGSYNVFESCINNKVAKLVFSSSASVYGDAEYNPINEKHPFNNKNFYGATKISGEVLLNALHHRYGIKYVGLRYMNVYGERQDQKGAYVAVIMKMIDSIFNNISPVIYGKGDEAFDFINVKDCAAANILAMKSNINNGFYNVGTGKKTKLIDLAKLLLDLNTSDLKILFKKQKNKTLVKNRIGSTLKANKDLKFKSKISLKKGLIDLIKYLENE